MPAPRRGLELGPVPPFLGTKQGIRVTVFGLSCPVRPNGDDDKAPPFGGFGQVLADQMYRGGAIPITTIDGVLRRLNIGAEPDPHKTGCGGDYPTDHTLDGPRGNSVSSTKRLDRPATQQSPWACSNSATER